MFSLVESHSPADGNCWFFCFGSFFCWGFKQRIRNMTDSRAPTEPKGITSVTPLFVELSSSHLDQCVLAKPHRIFPLFLVLTRLPHTQAVHSAGSHCFHWQNIVVRQQFLSGPWTHSNSLQALFKAATLSKLWSWSTLQNAGSDNWATFAIGWKQNDLRRKKTRCWAVSATGLLPMFYSPLSFLMALSYSLLFLLLQVCLLRCFSLVKFYYE